MTTDLPQTYDELMRHFSSGKTITLVIPRYTRRTFQGCVRRTDRLRRLSSKAGVHAALLAVPYLLYYETRLFIVTRGNRQLTAAALIYQLASAHIQRIDRHELPSGDEKLTFVGRVNADS